MAEVEKHHRACVVCTMLRGGESKIEKLVNVRGEAACSNVERYMDSSARWGDEVRLLK